MKTTIYLITCTATAVNMLVACTAGKQARKRLQLLLHLDADSRQYQPVQMDLTFRVPQHLTFSKRSRLIITPQLMVNDSLVQNCRWC